MSRPIKIALIIAGVLLLLGILSAIFLFATSSEDDQGQPDSTATTTQEASYIDNTKDKEWEKIQAMPPEERAHYFATYTGKMRRTPSGVQSVSAPKRDNIDDGIPIRSGKDNLKGTEEYKLIAYQKEGLFKVRKVDGDGTDEVVRMYGVYVFPFSVDIPEKYIDPNATYESVIFPTEMLLRDLKGDSLFLKFIKTGEASDVKAAQFFDRNGKNYQDMIVKYGAGEPIKEENKDDYLKKLNREAYLDMVGYYNVYPGQYENALREREGLKPEEVDQFGTVQTDGK